MAYLQYSIAPIEGYSGETPQYDPLKVLYFDTIRMPPTSAQIRRRVLRREGVAGHGLMILPPQADPIELVATRFVETTADGFILRNLLRGLGPQAVEDFEAPFGVTVVVAGIPSVPYDLLAADVSPFPRRILDQTGALTPTAQWRFDYRVQLIEQVPPVTSV